ncbi:Ger(x)C family spore germination protein [Virgibacillus sp. MSP4-1]|uniref:Ger(x)C family spore germination protein n=1 Tax=Virgibacillus sp. MSP4-1 TaxID=2700081 RepID=UPI0003A3A60A|nr:Ger(x)C family spore germination protein [Virgibacillus sp. MSP4-1]QHS21795.1 Ger(x)C family spore germination protein [Virgibacillus sp. MSP4-1]
MANLKGICLVSFCLLFFLTGCWDSIELEERAFIYGIGIDLEETGTNGKPIFRMTNQLIVPSGIGTSAQSGGGDTPAFRNVSQTGRSLADINLHLSEQVNRTLNAQQMEIAIVSQDLAKQPDMLSESLDILIRGQQLRRGIKLVISNGNADELLAVEPEHIKIPTRYLSRLLDTNNSGEAIEPLRIGKVHLNLLTRLSFVIPYLTNIDNQNVLNKGAAAFNGRKGKVTGLLNGKETEALNMILGNLESGSLIIPVGDGQATVEFMNSNSEYKLKKHSNDGLEFNIQLNLTGSISENLSSLDPINNITPFEKNLKKEIKKTVEHVVKRAQEDLKTDIFDLNIYLRGYHYKLWKRIKNDWDSGENIFSKSKINIHVNTKLEHAGNTIKSHKREERK